MCRINCTLRTRRPIYRIQTSTNTAVEPRFAVEKRTDKQPRYVHAQRYTTICLSVSSANRTRHQFASTFESYAPNVTVSKYILYPRTRIGSHNTYLYFDDLCLRAVIRIGLYVVSAGPPAVRRNRSFIRQNPTKHHLGSQDERFAENTINLPSMCVLKIYFRYFRFSVERWKLPPTNKK